MANINVSYSRRLLFGFDHLFYRIKINRICMIDQEPQGLINRCLVLFGSQFKDFQILLIGLLDPMLPAQDIIGYSELTCGKHVVFVTIVLKGPGFADQGVYDVAIIDVMAVFTAQSG